MHPPIAKEKDHATVWHGEKIIDPYYWIKAQNWQEVMREPSRLAPDIKTYLEAENAYTDSILADTQDLQKTLFEEMKARYKKDDDSLPYFFNGYWSTSLSLGLNKRDAFIIPHKLRKKAMICDL